LVVTIQVEESIKGGKNTSYHSQFVAPSSSSAVPASATESASASAPAGPSNLHLCRAEKVSFIPFMYFDGFPLSFCSKFWVPFVVSCGDFHFVIFEDEIAY
jgi:hypothetical protein